MRRYYSISVFFCLLLAAICSTKAQTTFNKRLKNIDSSISADNVGWGCGVQYVNGHIYNWNSNWDSTGLIGAYNSLLQMDDTGKTTKQLVFRADSFRYGIVPRCLSSIISSDGSIAFVGVKKEKYYNTVYPKNWSLFARCNTNGDTLFTRLFRDSSWSADSFYVYPERITQIPSDSSYIITGSLFDYWENRKTLVLRYGKSGNLIWHKLININGLTEYCTGTWTRNSNIYFSILNGGALDHSIIWFNNYIIKMDTSGQILETTYLPSQAMHGGFNYTKYNDEKIVFAGRADTMLSYVGMNAASDFDSYELTVAGGLLDNQKRVLWRWLIPMDNLGGTKIVDLEAGKKLSNGDIIFFGSRGSLNLPNNGIWGAWLTRTDSIGNMLWDRVYTVKEALHPETDNIYMSDVCEADNGDIILTGTEMQHNDVQHAWTLRVGSDGNISPTDSGYVGTDIYGNYPYIRIFQNFSYPNATIEVGLLANEDLKLFPNPTLDKLYVMYNIHEDSELIIYDLLGKPLSRKLVQFNNNQIELDVSELPCGEYFLVMSSGNGNVSKRFIKR